MHTSFFEKYTIQYVIIKFWKVPEPNYSIAYVKILQLFYAPGNTEILHMLTGFYEGESIAR